VGGKNRESNTSELPPADDRGCSTLVKGEKSRPEGEDAPGGGHANRGGGVLTERTDKKITMILQHLGDANMTNRPNIEEERNVWGFSQKMVPRKSKTHQGGEGKTGTTAVLGTRV